MAQACGINFRHPFEFSICVRVLTHVDSLASESHPCQEHDTKPDLIQRPGVLVVAVAGAPATVPAEMMWKLSGTWRPSRPRKRRTFSEVHFAAVKETSPTDIALELLVLSIAMLVAKTKQTSPKQLPGDKLPTSLC